MKRTSVLLASGIFMVLLFLQFSCVSKKEAGKEKTAGIEQKAAKDEEKAAQAEEKAAKTEEKAGEATAKEAAKTEEKGAGAETAAEEGKLLADIHKAAGNQCSDCHAENPPSQAVPTETCMGCHEDYNESAASYIDPHSAHVEFTDCGDCHHVHKESENQCLSCHTFNLKAP
ncbi:MAG: hypothetical protein EHM45_23500 [Desulfobacteraceae bacterium]|nr:MAG: hypothetical protein EHM45_23500 [Desulfobacteraceae bacterium]